MRKPKPFQIIKKINYRANLFSLLRERIKKAKRLLVQVG